MQGGSRDPATPWFDAAQERVPDSPSDPLSEHPIRRALGGVAFPATRAEVLAALRARPDVTPDQVDWTASSLPDRTFSSDGDVVAALARSGPPAPGAERSL
jgi:hypothetical protein